MLQDKKGYTLIELLVVVILIGLMMGLTIPRFQYAILTDNLKASARKMVGIITGLRNDAIREHKEYDLRFDLEANLFWIDSPEMGEEERAVARGKAAELPKDVRFQDVWLQGEERKLAGETFIPFDKKGYVPPSLIHLKSEDGREFTLLLTPFMHKVKVLEKYADFSDY